MENNLGLSLVAFGDVEEIRSFYEEQCSQPGLGPGFELSYVWDSEQTKELSFLKGRILSGHAPCPGGAYLPNLGSRDPLVIKESLDSLVASAAMTASLGGSILVLHAGYTMDLLVYRDFERRKAVLETLKDQEEYLWLEEGAVCSADYPRTSFYKEYLLRTAENLREATRICSEEGVKLAVENLNPRLSYLFQHPEDFNLLLREVPEAWICLDIGHLWISALVHNFDFRVGLSGLLETGRVVTSHIHDNRSCLSLSIYIGDDHRTIGSGNVPIEEAVKLICEKSDANLMIETKGEPLENYLALKGLAAKVNN